MPKYSFACGRCGSEKDVTIPIGTDKKVFCECGTQMWKTFSKKPPKFLLECEPEEVLLEGDYNSTRKRIDKEMIKHKEELSQLKDDLERERDDVEFEVENER